MAGGQELPAAANELRLGTHVFGPGHVAIMAVINRTDDSFFPGARSADIDQALRRAERAVADGADILDIGGVRAGRGREISVAEEIDRVVPLIAALRSECGDRVALSVDTWRSKTAQAACEAGVDLINDTWAGFDPDVVAVAGDRGVGLVCSHTGAMTPRTDPFRPAYPSGPDGEGVVEAVAAELQQAATRALAAGVAPSAIVLDPTLDFGKTTWHSLALLRRTERFVGLGHPVLLAASRKDFVGESLGLEVGERLTGSLAAVAIGAWLGISAVRVHDVAESRRVLDFVAAIRGERAPASAARGLF